MTGKSYSKRDNSFPVYVFIFVINVLLYLSNMKGYVYISKTYQLK